ncbi:Oidioi.mRNA.OKI2018_I69.PAR.g9107.t1.cds [Oikopleura dioica]|uniref:Oidioi.mRNA.OKI2018_I69.PAR.g9107.t1.cds n=1 Tax=Oikopleura dioica TaxID=34765 RepID=A0ABN7RPX5_OIKDI|nr:Oidioi.mRNA.OKI2018_I69.PAR.g9107.t1.cds [Oikopleura dioica]
MREATKILNDYAVIFAAKCDARGLKFVLQEGASAMNTKYSNTPHIDIPLAVKVAHSCSENLSQLLEIIYEFGNTKALLLKDSHGCNVYHYSFGLCALQNKKEGIRNMKIRIQLLFYIAFQLMAVVVAMFLACFLLGTMFFVWKKLSAKKEPRVFNADDVIIIDEEVINDGLIFHAGSIFGEKVLVRSNIKLFKKSKINEEIQFYHSISSEHILEFIGIVQYFNTSSLCFYYENLQPLFSQKSIPTRVRNPPKTPVHSGTEFEISKELATATAK